MNIWHGQFPNENTKDDGYDQTAPVSYFFHLVSRSFNEKLKIIKSSCYILKPVST